LTPDYYYVVRRHPQGGYAVARGTVTHNDRPGHLSVEVEPDLNDSTERYASLSEATAGARTYFSEHEALVHPECTRSVWD
jgi:hypothetical protein